jgi:mRNA-degrading endonuclease toxin of MazEF toxin-antitoxin module
VVRLDKDRPALVISSDALNRHALDICVIPITPIEHRNFTLRIPIRAGEGGLNRASWAKCDQMTTIEKSLFRYPPLGRLAHPTLAKIAEAIRFALELSRLDSA